MLVVRQWRYVALLHGAFFVSRQHRLCRRWPGALLCCIHEGLMCFFIVCGTMFTIGESRAISHANDTEQQPQQVAGNPCRWRFLKILPKLLWRTSTKIHRERVEEDSREAERTWLSTAKATSSIQRPQKCTWEAVTKYYNYTASETDEERKNRLPTLQKVTRRSGNALSLQSKLSVFSAAIGS